jgi:hypothetical protein
MHKTTVKSLRFGCGASLQSAFLHSHASGSRALIGLLEKESLIKTTSNKVKSGGSRK